MITAAAAAPRVAILGAGITGLTTAWQLQRAGCIAMVFEKAPRAGGTIGATQCDGWLHEAGPNSLLEGSPEVESLIDSVGLMGRRRYAASAAKRRYIVRRGRLVPMPTSPMSFLTTRLFSARAKLRLLGEPWRARGRADREETVANFVLRRLGGEFLDYAVNPFVGGVYAGDPKRLSVQQAFPKLHAIEQESGSLIRGAIKRRNASGGPAGRMFSFPNGLGELPAALAANLDYPMHLRTTVTAIRRATKGWELRCESDGQSWTEVCDAVVCALPANALALLNVEGVDTGTPLSILGKVEHPPVASVFTGYCRGDVAHPLDGFGALVPEVEDRQILGTLFSSTLFAGRAPEGHAALTTFIGGTRQPHLVGLDDSALVSIVHDELKQLVGARARPVFTHVRRWPQAIPQYTVGYQRYKNAIAAIEASAPGLFIGGNCRDGISLPNCIKAGVRLAASATTHLGRRMGSNGT